MPYTACFDKIEALKKEAVSTQAASKLADTSRAIGSFIGKIPVVKEVCVSSPLALWGLSVFDKND